MSDPIRIVGAVTGGEEVVAKFMAKGDAVRLSVTKALRRLGVEGKMRLKAAAPRAAGYRSPASLRYGRLRDRIAFRVSGAESKQVVLKLRPLPFRALFLEYGWTKAATRRGNKNRLGYGPDRKVTVGKRWGAEGKVFASHTRATDIIDRGLYAPGNTIGKRLQRIEYRQARRPFTYKNTTHIAGRPFVRPVIEWIRSEAQSRIDGAVREALNGY